MNVKAIIRAHSIWLGMKSRCSTKSHASYFRYGGAGITVCDRWLDFETFLRDMGPPHPGQSIDRMDGTKGYSPENCRWATREEQQNNLKSNVNLTFDGKTQSMGKWAREIGLNYSTLQERIDRGMPVELALSKENFRNVSGLKLGGAASGAKNRAKTHCKWGHEFTPENTRPNGIGGKGRGCKACHSHGARRKIVASDITPTRKNAVLITLGETTLSAAEWAKKLGIARTTIMRRVKDGKSVEEILSVTDLPHAFLNGEPPIAAIRRAQTHCKRGHPLSGENLYEAGQNKRSCKTCRREIKRRFNAKAKAARHARGLKRINPRWATSE